MKLWMPIWAAVAASLLGTGSNFWLSYQAERRAKAAGDSQRRKDAVVDFVRSASEFCGAGQTFAIDYAAVVNTLLARDSLTDMNSEDVKTVMTLMDNMRHSSEQAAAAMAKLQGSRIVMMLAFGESVRTACLEQEKKELEFYTRARKGFGLDPVGAIMTLAREPNRFKDMRGTLIDMQRAGFDLISFERGCMQEVARAAGAELANDLARDR